MVFALIVVAEELVLIPAKRAEAHNVRWPYEQREFWYRMSLAAQA